MDRAQLQRLFEFVNGGWAICCAVLAVVAACYLVTSWRDLGLRAGNLLHLPVGMRVAVGILGVGVADGVVRGSIWLWRVNGGGDFAGGFLAAVILGATLGCASFLLLVKELGWHMFGNAPWVSAVVSVILFVSLSLLMGR